MHAGQLFWKIASPGRLPSEYAPGPYRFLIVLLNLLSVPSDASYISQIDLNNTPSVCTIFVCYCYQPHSFHSAFYGVYYRSCPLSMFHIGTPSTL
jgi:hypothetical protein